MNKLTLGSQGIVGFIMSVLFSVAAFLFFGLFYPHHLHFQEQYQLFLFDADYISDILAVPGGVADCVGRYLTQFFLFPWVGAAIVALLLLCIVLLTVRMMRPGEFLGLSLLPALFLWIYFCDENALLGTIVAFLLAQASEWGLTAIPNRKLRLVGRLVAVPVLYWAIGPMAVVCILMTFVSAFRRKDKLEMGMAGVSLLLLLVMPLIAEHCVTLPLFNLYVSPHYYRYPLLTPYVAWIAVLCIAVLPWIPSLSNSRYLSLSVWIILLAASVVAVKMTYDPDSEELMSYDYMARNRQWNRIVETANKKKPNNSLCCTALNLALGMKGQLADRMFGYHQNGLPGLLPELVSDPVSPLTTGEVFYQLGMINVAQRFVFEAQETIPDYQKSGRCYQRLAETNLIGGNYEVARKYLTALKKTLFYADWAEEMLSHLGDEAYFNHHKEYGRLRSYMPAQDYMFSEQETTQMLGRQVLSNPKNRLAYEYLLGAYLLQKDLDSFVRCLGLGSELDYLQMPAVFQEAYLLWWSRDHTVEEQIPNFITSKYFNGINQFYAIAQKEPADQNLLKSKFGNTYWYYYFY